MEEDDFRKNLVFKGVNSKLGRNLAEKLDLYIKYIDQDERVVGNLEAILGRSIQY